MFVDVYYKQGKNIFDTFFNWRGKVIIFCPFFKDKRTAIYELILLQEAVLISNHSPSWWRYACSFDLFWFCFPLTKVHTVKIWTSYFLRWLCSDTIASINETIGHTQNTVLKYFLDVSQVTLFDLQQIFLLQAQPDGVVQNPDGDRKATHCNRARPFW